MFGAIAGNYYDASSVTHGFLLTPYGKMTTFDAPGAGTGAGQGTYPLYTTCLNPAGAIVGSYIDANNVYHGFLRNPNGTIATIDVPGAQATFPNSINLEGAISGQYIDANSVNHGFVRNPDGKMNTFDVPGAGTGSGLTCPQFSFM